jgi:hypothetical protein
MGSTGAFYFDVEYNLPVDASRGLARRALHMNHDDRHGLVQQLGKAMSDISEDCYCAGWMRGTEYLVPELCRRAVEFNRVQHWGHGEVTPELARELWALAERAGCWAVEDDASVAYDPFQPFPIPPEYIEGVERDQTARQRQA